MRIPTLVEIVRDKQNVVIHTPTIEDAEKLLSSVPLRDPKDVNKPPYEGWLSYWNFYKENTCYHIREGVVDGYCEADFYKSEGYTIYDYKDIE